MSLSFPSPERACQLMLAHSMRTVAHAVGSPLNVILGRAELLLEDPLAPVVQTSVRSIRDQCEKIRSNIERPLRASEISARSAALVAASEVVREPSVWLEPELTERFSLASADGAAEGAKVAADDTKLALWALTALASRLVPGPIALSLDEQEDRVEFCVSMTGEHLLQNARDLSQPWRVEGLPQSTWVPAMLLHAISSEHDMQARVESAKLCVSIRVSRSE